MDPLSITASVIAVIGLAGKIISLCQGYVNTMKGAPSDLRTIMVETGSLKSVVRSLEFLLSSWGPGNMLHIVKSLEGPEGPLEASRKALVALEKLFPPATDHNATGTKRRATSISYAKLAWPFKEEKARKILNDIARYKATISLALTTDTANDSKVIKANVERLCEALDLETLGRVLKWLVKTDPSPNHNTACALHDSHTGTWMTRSNEYQDWKNGSARFLWFHGIPGAGKTILFSYIVEDIKQYCKTMGVKDITYSYYYCYFGRSQDEAPHFLRWVINQLCRKSRYVPKQILDCFRTGEQPSVPVLAQALSTVLCNFRRVYLMLDALDETLDRQNLLRLLNQLAGDSFDKLVLLAASRKEIDIEISLKPISTNMSLSNPYVDEDIKIYIENQLQDHHKLRTWPKSLSDEISAALVKGAKGMFRWAACQIDILGRLHNVSDIRKALHELPETLDETYERILMKIPQKSSKIAHKVLQLLAFHNYEFKHIDALAEALAVDVEQLSFNPEKRLIDRNALFEICTCLVTLTENTNVILAHYSVKEYLVSERIRLGPATSFQISDVSSNALAAKICLVYLLDITYEGSCSFGDYLGMTDSQRQENCVNEKEIFPLLSKAIAWGKYILFQDAHIRAIQGPDTALLDGLLIRLFNPKELHYKKWQDRQKIYHYGLSEPIGYRDWKTQPGAELTLAFANACRYDLIETAKVILESNPNLSMSGDLLEADFDYAWNDLNVLRAGTRLDLLDLAIFFVRDEFVDLLLNWGANPNGNSPDGCCKLMFALKIMRFGDEYGGQDVLAMFNIFESLLGAGLNPNPRGLAITPLQAAVLCNDSSVVEQLLDAGAHVNAVGDDEAIVASIKRRSTTEQLPLITESDLDGTVCDFDFEEEYLSRNEISELVRKRSSRRNYETPLRIVENQLDRADSRKRDILLEMKEYLVEKGGKPLKLYPGQNFQGHLGADDSHRSMSKGRISYIIN